jgi:phosphatidylserine decarboxylase
MESTTGRQGSVCEPGKWDHLIVTHWPHYLALPLFLLYINEKLLSICILSFFLFFFRSPDRRPMLHAGTTRNNLYSPADGTVMNVRQEKNRNIIEIFLSVADVHIQYAPAAATVSHQRYKKGKFNAAYIMEKSKYNERLETDFIVTENKAVVTVVQIAGQLAQRIESWIKKGDTVLPGCKIGIIKFGSRVDISFPRDIYGTVAVQKGQHVTGGRTLLNGGPVPRRPPFDSATAEHLSATALKNF